MSKIKFFPNFMAKFSISIIIHSKTIMMMERVPVYLTIEKKKKRTEEYNFPKGNKRRHRIFHSLNVLKGTHKKKMS